MASSDENKALEAKVELLEQRLRDLNARLAAVQGKYDHRRAEPALLTATGAVSGDSRATASGGSFDAASVDVLIEIAQLLSASVGATDAIETCSPSDDLVAQVG